MAVVAPQGLGSALVQLASDTRQLVADLAHLAVLDARRAGVRLAMLASKASRINPHNLSAYRLYLSGPEPMVENFYKTLRHKGFGEDRLVTDYFPGYQQF